MAKIVVGYADYLKSLFERMANGGVLLASLDPHGKANPMTIGWGTVGVVWGRPIFTVLVRPSRYTYACIEHTNDFTVNLPREDDRESTALSGKTSGRDRDKLADLNWGTLPSEAIETPVLEPCVLHYECRVVQKTDVVPDAFFPPIIGQFYPKGDFHRVYFGEILRVTADEDFVKKHTRAK